VILKAARVFENCDVTCVLEAGCHSTFRTEHFIDYQWARTFEPRHFAALEAKGCYESLDSIDPELLRRIQQGALNSPFTPRHLKDRIRTLLDL
jgi:hypothetical protein